MAGPAACLVPLVAMAAGTGMQMAAAQQSRNAMERKTKQELARQSQFRDKARKEYALSEQQSTPEVAQQQISEGAAERGALYEKLQNVPLGESQASTAAPTAVQRMVTAADTNRANQARAQLGGYSNWSLQQGIKNLRASQQLGLINNQAQSSQRVLPYEIDNASHAGDSLAGIGQLVSLLGSAYGLMSAMAPVAKAATMTAAPAATTFAMPKQEIPSGYGTTWAAPTYVR